MFFAKPKQQNKPELAKELEQSAKMLIRRDFELSDINDRYDTQLVEFIVLQEAILLANQIKDKQQMFTRVGGLLLQKLNYDRFFIIEQYTGGTKPLVALGFDDSPFEALYETMQTSGVLQALFQNTATQLFTPSVDQLGNQVLGILNVSSASVVHIDARNYKAILVVAMDQPLEALDASDVNFLTLLASQLNVIVDNIDSFTQLERQNIELRQLDKAKTMFLSIASHQLRTPLSVMKFALSHLLNTAVGALNEKQNELVVEMRRSNNRLINLVNSLLSITRIQQGKVVINPETIHLSAMLAGIVTDLAQQIQGKNIQVSVAVPETVTLVADKMLIQEAFTNLINNGIKYNKVGGSLAVNAKETADQLIVTVQDSGIGIAPEDQSRIFSAFYRSDTATKVDPDGVGLGLYVTRQFIQLHGGTISFTSAKDQGTIFMIVFPKKV